MTASEIQSWLIARISEAADLDPRQIDPSQPLTTYGLTSRDAVGLSGNLEDLMGTTLSPTVVYEYPTIEALAAYLSGECNSVAQFDSSKPEAIEEVVAIVGIGCRFPQADGPAAFWRLLKNGLDAVTEIPSTRWNAHEL